jgi:hypothetical protein
MLSPFFPTTLADLPEPDYFLFLDGGTIPIQNTTLPPQILFSVNNASYLFSSRNTITFVVNLLPDIYDSKSYYGSSYQYKILAISYSDSWSENKEPNVIYQWSTGNNSTNQADDDPYLTNFTYSIDSIPDGTQHVDVSVVAGGYYFSERLHSANSWICSFYVNTSSSLDFVAATTAPIVVTTPSLNPIPTQQSTSIPTPIPSLTDNIITCCVAFTITPSSSPSSTVPEFPAWIILP